MSIMSPEEKTYYYKHVHIMFIKIHLKVEVIAKITKGFRYYRPIVSNFIHRKISIAAHLHTAINYTAIVENAVYYSVYDLLFILLASYVPNVAKRSI